MRLIAQRGNFAGKDKVRENTFDYLIEAIENGFDVEVDIWKIESSYFLGHDGPEHRISFEQLKELQPHAWFHAKNFDALDDLLQKRFHVFFHDQDEYTITSKG